MEAIHLDQPNNGVRRHRYAGGGISVTPNPPQVGVVSDIVLYLKNPGSQPLTVSRIETRVAQFGIGVGWEELPAIGPLQLPGDAKHIEEVKVQWMPRTGGHRCVRASIYLEVEPQPFMVGCNLHVIESEAERNMWRVPFRLGNPERERMPIVLEANNTDAVTARVVARGRLIPGGQAIWLNPGEEVDAFLLLRAHTPEALGSVNTLEATIGGRFLDGIQVVVHRPVWKEPEVSRFARNVMREREVVLDEAATMMYMR